MSNDADLGQHLEEYVSTLVRDGRYESRNDVLRDGIRLIEQRERAWRVSMPPWSAGLPTPMPDTSSRRTTF